MKRFIPLNELISEKKMSSWIDKLTFFRIFFIWTVVIVLFGVFYFIFSGVRSYLYFSRSGESVEGLLDYIYFSFITATSTGYGDIVPLGIFKLLALVEVIFGLLLLAFVTSKLISIKQDIILNELYEISFNEKISRLRSSLLLFRQNINRLIGKVEGGVIRKREIYDIYTYLSSLEDTINELLFQMDKPEEKRFTKVIDPMNTELIFISITHSFERFYELITLLNQNNLEWRRDVTIELINKCISIDILLFEKLNSSKKLAEKNRIDLNAQNEKAISMLKKEIEPQPAVEIVK